MKSLAIIVLVGLVGCASQTQTIPGTKLPDTPENRAIIDRLEEYRLAVERQDAAALVLMASKRYWEDGGTPSGSDDYGYEQLRDVLTGRFQQADEIRYSLRYVDIRKACPEDDELRKGCRAYVDVLIDASFSVPDAHGELKRKDKRDQNQIVLEHTGDTWKFLSGM